MNARRLMRLPKSEDDSLPHQAALLCITANLTRLCPSRVIGVPPTRRMTWRHVRCAPDCDRIYCHAADDATCHKPTSNTASERKIASRRVSPIFC